jgi:putative zinc finger protein
MDHSFIEETNQIDRYVRGTMAPAERAAFEEHFLDCSVCLEQLEIAKSMRESVRVAAAELASSGGRTAEKRRTWSWNWMTAGAFAALAAMSFTSIAVYRQLEHTRGELDRTQLAYARQRDGASDMLRNSEPLVYTMSLSRGAASASKPVELPRSPRWVVFSIQIDASQYRRYRAILRNEAGQPIFQKDGLEPSSPDTIAIPVLSTVLKGGGYTLILEGQDPSGRYQPVSTFPVQADTQH